MPARAVSKTKHRLKPRTRIVEVKILLRSGSATTQLLGLDQSPEAHISVLSPVR